MDIKLLAALAVSFVLIGWAFWIASPKSGADALSAVSAVVVDGTQFIDMRAKGGYAPRVITAKAGMPTILRVTTDGTFDCSASLVIPKLSYQKFLPSSGTEDIRIAAEQAQGTLQGLCSMGMYNFQINFQP